MKQLFSKFVPLAAAFVVMACNNGTEGDKAGQPQETELHDDTAVQPSSSPAVRNVRIKDDHLNAIYQQYIHLTTALTSGDPAEAKIAASAIEAGARAGQGFGAIASSAATITAAPDMEAQRTAYSALSSEMISRVKQSGVSNGELYVEFCPMALADKGAYWLSNEKVIKNPYFGDNMLSCGEIMETINE